MIDLTLLVLDIILAIIVFIVGLKYIPKLARWAGYNITFFKVQKMPKKEVMDNFEKKEKRLKLDKEFVK